MKILCEKMFMFCCFLFFCNINLALSWETFTYSVSVHTTCSLFV